jgi:hypothetical protein
MMRSAVRLVEHIGEQSPVVRNYVDGLRERISRSDFALDSRATNEFLQFLGEAHFVAICFTQGIRLERVPETDTPTPDFKARVGAEELHFEVKTLSVAKGEFGIDLAIENSASAIAQAESKGSRHGVGIGISVVSPFGAGARIAKAADVLLEKIRQNIKIAQYKFPNTFLVVDLSMLQVIPGGTEALKRRWPDPGVEAAEVSGLLWMVAFGQPTMRIHDFADFEGESNDVGAFGKQGILVDPAFDDISGLLFVFHPWGRPSNLWGLFRSRSMADPVTVAVLNKLVLGHWNNELDGNAHAF